MLLLMQKVPDLRAQNPHVIHEKQMSPEKFTGSIIESHLFENADRIALSVDSKLP